MWPNDQCFYLGSNQTDYNTWVTVIFDVAVEKLKHEIFQSVENDESSLDHCSSSDCEIKTN